MAEGGEATLDSAFTYTKSSICRNGDPDSDCQVDIDNNMITVVYEDYNGNGSGSWRIVTKAEIDSTNGSWYDYGNKKWANAITLRDDFEGGCFAVLSETNVNPRDVVYFSDSFLCSSNARTQSSVMRAADRIDGTVYTPLGLAKAWHSGELPDEVNAQQLNETLFDSDVSDGTSKTEVILGYWVYIPRYAYEVQRRDANNTVVQPTNFNIVFETKDTPKKTPIECLNGDYQTCVGTSALTYPNTTSQDDPLNNQTAWATHPAFTWGAEELNGFWIGKFETTGTRTAPTVKPNQHANVSEYIGEFYSAAKSIGYPDPNNQYGGASSDDTTRGLTQNSHNLAAATSHMLKNSEWGAVAYLSASKYGAGVNEVQINAAYLLSGSTDADGDSSRYGATGCGPSSDGVETHYSAGTLNKTAVESLTACGSADMAYNGSIGKYASTTNNVYGVYDVSGGAWEYVMGNYTTNTNLSQTTNSLANFGEVKTPIKLPYVDLYNIDSSSDCTWSVGGSGCGGHALFETVGWGDDYANLLDSSVPWFGRGGYSDGDPIAGVFASRNDGGNGDTGFGFRVALIAN